MFDITFIYLYVLHILRRQLIMLCLYVLWRGPAATWAFELTPTLLAVIVLLRHYLIMPLLVQPVQVALWILDPSSDFW